MDQLRIPTSRVAIVMVACLFLPALVVAEPPSAGEREVLISHSGAGIILQSRLAYDRATLVVAGPNGYRSETHYEAGVPITINGFDIEGNVLADGLYKYELRVIQAQREAAGLERGDEGQAPSGRLARGSTRVSTVSGGFTVTNGALQRPSSGEGVVSAESRGQAPTNSIIGPPEGVFDAGDWDISGDLGVGKDGSTFTGIHMQKSFPNIGFDTNTSEATMDGWRVNGPSDRFSIMDVPSGSVSGPEVFRIDRNAPVSSLHVDSSGHIGVGTSVPLSGPVRGVDIVKPTFPGVNLIPTGSGQTWSYWGGAVAAGLFDATAVRDVMVASTPCGNMQVGTSGAPGCATGTPRFQVFGTGNVVTANGGALQAKNSGVAANIRFTQEGVQSWLFLNSTAGLFSIFDEDSGASAVTVFPGHSGPPTLAIRDSGIDVNGAILQRGGTIHPDYVFEPDFRLESIEEHAEFMWDNKHLPAVPKGTVDEAGLPVLDIGAHQKGILEELEKAHIYIEQLNGELKAKEDRLGELEAENAAILGRLARLESLVSGEDGKAN